MATPSVTYTFVNATSADATQVNTNFTDIISALTDSTADLTVGTLVVSGAVTLSGNSVSLGNSTSDVLSITSRITGDVTPTASASYSFGSSSLGWTGIYLGANSQTVRIAPNASMSSTYTVTLPATVPSTTDAILTSNTSGAISFSHTITTLKGFDGGAYSVEYVGTNPEVGGSSPFQLTTAHKRIQVINPAGAGTVRLPTTSIKSGDKWMIVNRSTNSVTIQSSDTSAIDIIDTGFIYIVALQDTPTSSAHWRVVEYYSEITHSSTYTFNGTGSPGTSGSITHYIKRSNNIVSIVSGLPNATTGTNSSILTMDTAFGSHYRPTSSQYIYVPVMVSGAIETTPGFMLIQTSGKLAIYRTAAAGVFPNATGSCGAYNGIVNLFNACYAMV